MDFHQAKILKRGSNQGGIAFNIITDIHTPPLSLPYSNSFKWLEDLKHKKMYWEKLNVTRGVSLIYALQESHTLFLSLYQLNLSFYCFQSPRDPSLLAQSNNMCRAGWINPQINKIIILEKNKERNCSGKASSIRDGWFDSFSAELDLFTQLNNFQRMSDHISYVKHMYVWIL